MVLDEKELLQANATIIAGILILFTIGSTLISTGFDSSILTRMILAAAILPFIASGVVLLSQRIKKDDIRTKYAKITTLYGLMYLGVAVLYFVIML